jgi:hypothetical protein
VAAGVEGMGAILTSGNAATAGPTRGVAGSASRRGVEGDCGAVLSGLLSREETRMKFAEFAADRIRWGVMFAALS